MAKSLVTKTLDTQNKTKKLSLFAIRYSLFGALYLYSLSPSLQLMLR